MDADMVEGALKFSFSGVDWVFKYDEDDSFKRLQGKMQFECECEKCESHHCQKDGCDKFADCKRQQKAEGLKGADFAVKAGQNLYLVEVKDFRTVRKPPVEHIAAEVAKKFRDTLFGIWAGAYVQGDDGRKQWLEEARDRNLTLRLVFHFESPIGYRSGFLGEKSVAEGYEAEIAAVSGAFETPSHTGRHGQNGLCAVES